MGKKKRWSILFRGLTLVWMVVIFWFSSQEAEASQSLSDGFLTWLLEGGLPVLSELLNALRVFEVLPIRKCAHAVAYLLLGCLSTAAAGCSWREKATEKEVGKILWQGKARGWMRKAWLFCAAYAMLDELHQLFVAGRSAQLGDVALDSVAALIGVCGMGSALLLLWKKERNQEGSEGD